MTGEEGYTVVSRNRYTIDSWSRHYTGQVAFFLGLFVGAGAAILFTSMSGKEARDRLVATSKTLSDQVGTYYATARGTVIGAVEKGTSWVSEVGPSLAAAIQSGIEAYTAEKRRVAREISEASS